MTFYRETFTEATVLPKMHILERHLIAWMEEKGVGLGLMGEQGAESIHAAINGIKAEYRSIPDRVKRLSCILQEHHRHACPTLTLQEPAKKKRKLKEKD